MSRFFGGFARALLLLLFTAAPPVAAEGVRIAISCGAVGIELALCREGAEAWARQTGNEVEIVSTPNSATERLALYQQLLAAGTPDIDVFQIDVIWPGMLDEHLIDLAPYSDGAEQAHVPAIVANNTVDGRLVAMPWYVDAGLLFYRRDLLERYGEPVPRTWQQLTGIARRVQAAERAAGNTRFWGFVWQGRAYEGLTCNALEWLDAFGGGTLVDAGGDITLRNPRAAEALSLARSWVGEITPPGVLNYDEEAARGVFQSGHALFMRNWPYAWALAQSPDSPIRGKVGVSPLPSGGPEGKRTGVLGGWQLAVSRYSEHPEQAADLVMYLTSRAEQRRRALAGAYNPTITGLYEDPALQQALPFAGALSTTVLDAVARPSRVTGRQYNRVSFAFWNAVHDTLAGRGSAEANLERAYRDLRRWRRRGW